MYNHLVYQNGKLFLNGWIEYSRGYLFLPYFIKSFPWLKISLYGLFLSLAFLFANYFVHKEIARRGLPQKIAGTLTLLSLFGGLLGAKLFYFFEGTNNWSSLVSTYDLFFRYGGLTWYGGFLLATGLITLYLKIKSIAVLSVADSMVWILAFSYALGRLGSVLAGDGSYGIAAPEHIAYPWAAAFPNGSAPWLQMVERYQDVNLRVYNISLMESVFSLALGIIFYVALFLKRWQNFKDGWLFYSFLLLHSLSRFVLEFWRLNEKIFFGLTQAQTISIILFAFSFFYLIYLGFFKLYPLEENV